MVLKRFYEQNENILIKDLSVPRLLYTLSRVRNNTKMMEENSKNIKKNRENLLDKME